MGIVHRVPSQATVKELFANAFRCAFPGCRRPLYRVDPETGDRTLNSHVSHICARSEGGPRWDPMLSEDENRSVDNLLLLCYEHAWEIDQPGRIAAYPATLLREWKLRQLKDFDAVGRQGWGLTAEMADEALRTSLAPITISDSILNLGGAGGNAPGAGGGGGGALGPNARGGTGGPGGAIRYEGAPSPMDAANGADRPEPQANPALIERLSHQDYRLPTGAIPGAGGGGAGAVGENAIGGDGGGGGERVIAVVSQDELAALRAAGFERFEFTIGEGGAGGDAGQHGSDGGDTVLNFVAGDGRIIRTIRAVGGPGGKSGFAIPTGAREVTGADIAHGLSVSTLLAADALHMRHGLFYVLGGGWERWNTLELPANVQWPVVCVVTFGCAAITLPLALFAVVDDPSGHEVVRLPFCIANENSRLVANVAHFLNLQFSAGVAGVWTIRILSGNFELARLPLEISLQPA